MLVDNFISAFSLQVENGIPILPYYQGDQDQELDKLAGFLKSTVLGKQDVRPVLKDTFSLEMYHNILDVRTLVSALQADFRLAAKT